MTQRKPVPRFTIEIIRLSWVKYAQGGGYHRTYHLLWSGKSWKKRDGLIPYYLNFAIKPSEKLLAACNIYDFIN